MSVEESHFSSLPPNSVWMGVTGHRYIRNVEELIPQIDKALAFIIAHGPEKRLTVASSLAEGSDRLVAKRALAHFNARLVVPLPMPEAEYALDFHQHESRQEFNHLVDQADQVIRLQPGNSRPASYLQAAEYMVARSYALLALWDGYPAHGEGGTGMVVAMARNKEIPLAWILTCNCKPGIVHDLTMPQGRLEYEHF